MTIKGLLREIYEAERYYWFIHIISEVEQTDNALKVRLNITAGLFVQIFFSERTGRLSFALIRGSQRIYGCDREQNYWHRHPYGAVHRHEPMPEGMSLRPVFQFMGEVEAILVENELI
ncbi:MAG: hypothetical protein MAG431_00533 [Chloroflexi bacterium]|nr:hypothetical protein [Chloroflexota bacterium]